MKYSISFLSAFFALLILGCTSDSSDDSITGIEKETEIITLSSLEIEYDEVTQTSAKIIWSEVTASNASTVNYSVFLDDELVAENLAELVYTVEELEINTSYTVKIVASADDAEESINTSVFNTLGTPPSAFPITHLEIGCGIANISWPTPTVEDESEYYYEIYLNGDFYKSYSSYDTERTVFNLAVEEGAEHTIEVIAKSYNGTQTSEEITFFQEACPIPTDFIITASNITGTSATLNWTASTVSDGTRVYYLLTANGVSYPAPYTFTYATSYEFTNLERNTTYEVVISAEVEGNNKFKESTVTFTTTNDYPVHPTITITAATLNTPDSQFFGGQLNVTFSEEIADFDIQEWIAVAFEIENYAIYTSSISSSVLSNANYDSLAENKTGYLLIEDDGVVYQLNYTVSVETN